MTTNTALDAPTYTTAVPPSLVIQDGEDFANWGERLRAIATFRRKVTEWFAPMKSKAAAAHKEVCEKERQALAQAVADEAVIKRALVHYQAEQDRKRREERLALEAAERRKQEDIRLAEAAALEREAHATGNIALQEAADQLIESPVIVAPMTPTTPAPPKVDGLSFREVWKWDVVAEAAIPRMYLQVNKEAINRVVDGLKGQTNIPGIRVYCDKVPVTRTR